jgi:hypothetical protein
MLNVLLSDFRLDEVEVVTKAVFIVSLVAVAIHVVGPYGC